MTMICAKSLNAGVGCLLYIALSLVELRRWGEYLEGSGGASWFVYIKGPYVDLHEYINVRSQFDSTQQTKYRYIFV